MSKHQVAIVEGDGIGKEVVPEGIRVIEAAADRFDIDISWNHFPWSCETYKSTGKMMPDDGFEQLLDYSAIFLGAIGYPGVPDHVSLWGLLIPMRRKFDQYVNLRPCILLDGVQSPLRDELAKDIEFWIVRENVEGEYSEIGGRMYTGTPHETAIQQSVFTQRGVDRVLRYAFELANSRPRRTLTSATKSNGILHTMPFWDERLEKMRSSYPDVDVHQYHIDILTAHFVRDPQQFDVVVASNLFGDILSDLGPAVCGSIGIAPSASLNPERQFPSTFEPVHGSAPDIAGKGIANPIGQIWAGALMLDHLGHAEAATCIVDSIRKLLAEDGPRTPDLGGSATTTDVGKAITEIVATR